MDELNKAIMDYRKACDYLVAETRQALQVQGLPENEIIWCNAKVASESATPHSLAFMCGILIVELAKHTPTQTPYDPPSIGSFEL